MRTQIVRRPQDGLLLALLFLSMAWGTQVRAEVVPPEVRAVVAQPAQAGAGQFRYLGLKVYDLKLFTPRGNQFDASSPFALAIEYDRKIRRQVLLKATMGELERVEGARADHDVILEKLAGCYRGVQDGDRIVATPRGPDMMSFWVNGSQTCVLSHPGFRDRYMAIWMSDKSRDRALASRLRGQG